MLSFSQLSSQAIDLLLKSENQIETDYENALELSYRLNDNFKMINSVSDLLEKTNSLLYKITSFINITDNFARSYSDFTINVIDDDFTSIREYLNPIALAYNDTYKKTRLRTVQYISQAVDLVQDLDNYVQTASESFSNISDAQYFYRSFLCALNQCIASIRYAKIYLSLTQHDEHNLSNNEYRFYLNDSYEILCATLYSNILEDLNNFEPILNSIYEKISQWLQNNTCNISYLTSEDCKNNDIQNVTASERKIPGLLSLIMSYCNCDNSISRFNRSRWNILVKNFMIAQRADSAKHCLLQYEQSLNKLYISASQTISTIPTWKLGDVIAQYLNVLSNETKFLRNDVWYPSLLGSISLQDAMKGIQKHAYMMASNLSAIKEEIVTSQKMWKAEVTSWNDSVVNMYLSLLNELQTFIHFFKYKENAIDILSSLKIWQHPVIDISYVFGSDIDIDIINYVNSNCWSNITRYMTVTMTKAVSPNLDRSSVFLAQFNMLHDTWQSSFQQVLSNVNKFSNSFTIDDQFVR